MSKASEPKRLLEYERSEDNPDHPTHYTNMDYDEQQKWDKEEQRCYEYPEDEYLAVLDSSVDSFKVGPHPKWFTYKKAVEDIEYREQTYGPLRVVKCRGEYFLMPKGIKPRIGTRIDI